MCIRDRVATMLLAAIFFTGEAMSLMLTFPLLIGAVCILASVVGAFFVRLGADKKVMKALYKGFIVSAVLSAVLIGGVIIQTLGWDASMAMKNGLEVTGKTLFGCAIVGLVVTGLIVWVTEYYTCILYTSPSPRDRTRSRMPSSA
eukprot:TRINITY_DN12899_c0_g1_i1.p1 TRINITY_DN12899_c0_g1~~TRINITY_DN12899_c0_g1_i1.p1  ORF type:complete len:145 (-),score=48.32 TRINITY_DN12899_c0_g1_i1:7-441(-)